MGSIRQYKTLDCNYQLKLLSKLHQLFEESSKNIEVSKTYGYQNPRKKAGLIFQAFNLFGIKCLKFIIITKFCRVKMSKYQIRTESILPEPITK